jgi:transposase
MMEAANMRVATAIHLSSEQRQQLQGAARSRSLPLRVVERAQIVLLAADGLRNDQIAERLSTSRFKVSRWRERYAQQGFAGLEKDAPRPGRTPAIAPATVERIVQMTTQERPSDATHWSTRTLAAVLGVSASSVRRVWRAHGLKPHRVKTFKISKDPAFAEKLEDIVGLYLNPPEHAVILSTDEKSQIQALDRTQPGLPLKPGRLQTLTHDYKRNGTTTLFAALNTLDGSIIGQCRSRHTHLEWLDFLKLLEAQTPVGKTLHVIADNYATHKHPKVRRWLHRHSRVQMHFTPTSASWLNMIERFFRDLSSKRIRRGVFRSVPELIAAIESYIAHHNQQPKPFIWTAKASDILEKVKRSQAALHKLQSV